MSVNLKVCQHGSVTQLVRCAAVQSGKSGSLGLRYSRRPLVDMWVILVLSLTIALADELSESDTHELELSTFYADCSVYDDPALFGGHVCGSDGLTYSNCVHFACINHWRPDNEKVKIDCRGPCQTEAPPPLFSWSPIYSPVCGTNNLTYANIEALALYNEHNGVDTLVQYDGECVLLGTVFSMDITSWGAAVCASNGRTYPSVTAVQDLRKFGQCHDVLHDGGCTVDEVRERMRSRAELCDLARNFYEYNPVCGDDNISYPNPYIMLCFRPNVNAQYMGECDSALHNACQNAILIDQGEAQTPGPVCASDGLTYTSGSHLDCAKNNDKHLYLLHSGPCTAADNPCSTQPQVDDAGAPVCGSDGVTYIDSQALWCVQRKDDPFLRYFHDGPCFRRCVECSSYCCSDS